MPKDQDAHDKAEIDDEQILRNRETTIPIILDEVMRLREEQDGRLDHYRRVAGLLLGIFIPVSGLAALGIINLEGQFHGVSAAVAAAFTFVGIILAMTVLLPRKWGIGPDITELVNRGYVKGEDIHRVTYSLALSHFRRFEANEGKLKAIQWSYVAALTSFVVAVSVLTFGLVRYDEPVQAPDPEPSVGAAESSDGSSQSWPDLPEFELYNDTFAEKGAATQYRSEE